MSVQEPLSDYLLPPAEGRAGDLLKAQKSVLESIVRGRPLTEVLEALCEIVETQAGFGVRAAILLADSEQRHLFTGAAPSLPDEYNRAVDGIGIARDVGTCCAAAARREMVITRDIATDPGWRLLKHLPLGLGLHAAWSMPIVSSSGQVLGTFGTYFEASRGPTDEERQLVEVLAQTAALAIERQQADEAMRRGAARHRFLAELSAATQPLTDAADVMATTARMLAEHLGTDRCAYAEVEDERVFVITGDYSRGVPSIVGRWDVAAFGAACVRDMLEGRPYVVADTDAHPEINADDLQAYRDTNIRAVVCVPLHKKGIFTAAMAVHQTRPRNWSADDIDLVALVVARCWEALERSRVARSLKESEARYRAMIEASPECVKLVAADGTLLQMNQAGLRMLESDERILGRSIYEAIAPEHREAFRAFNERVCQGTGGEIEFEILAASGTRRSMESRAVALPTESGFVQLAVTRDITARVAAERALAENRARLQYAVTLSGIGFWYCDLPFSELIWDERVKAHFFLPPDARVTVDTFYERLHPEDREEVRAAIEQSIRDRRPYDVHYRTVDPSSNEFKWIRAVGGTGYAEDGTPIRFDGVTVDVTTQRKDQARLARLLEQEQFQARLLGKVASAALSIHACDSVDAVLKVLAEEARSVIGAHQSVTSLKKANAQAQVISTVSLSDKYSDYRHYSEPTTGQGIYSLVSTTNRTMRLTQAELESHRGYRDFSNHKGSHPPLRGWLAVPLIARDGSNLGLVQLSDKYEGEFTALDEAILIQLAQVGTVALENAQLYDQLRDQDRRKDEFLATLAHELRNPLAPIRTGLQVLQRSSDEERNVRARQMMERQLEHLVRMVDDLLDVSRVTLGKLSLKLERLDFRSVLQSAIETTRPLIETRGHELAIRLPKDPLPVDADPTRLGQVVSNLLNNAAKYTPQNGRIQVMAEVQDASLIVKVSDTGIGIPPAMIDQVFEMFTQVSRSVEHAQGGLGIGLTLVRRLVEMHGGTIQAHSEGLGRGSTFTLRLPLASGLSPSSSIDSGDELRTAQSALRILVVDDNIDAAESLSMLLALSGHLTSLAHTGPDALSKAKALKPDVVLLDIGLPGMTGYEVAQQLRRDQSHRPILIALTGWGAEEDRRRAHEAGFDHHLVKPVDGDALAAILASLRKDESTVHSGS